MERFRVVLAGKTPLLMNKMSHESLEKLRLKDRAPKTAPRLDPCEEAGTKVYTGPDGNPVMPVENLLASLIAAGVFVRLDGKRQLSTSQSTVLPGLLSIEDFIIPLRDPRTGSPSEFNEWGVAEWRYEIRQGRNPNGGEAVAIVRPRFDSWGMGFTVQLDTKALAETTFRELFDLSGTRIGLCDFRPARKGMFGQFRVDLWERIN